MEGEGRLLNPVTGNLVRGEDTEGNMYRKDQERTRQGLKPRTADPLSHSTEPACRMSSGLWLQATPLVTGSRGKAKLGKKPAYRQADYDRPLLDAVTNVSLWKLHNSQEKHARLAPMFRKGGAKFNIYCSVCLPNVYCPVVLRYLLN